MLLLAFNLWKEGFSRVKRLVDKIVTEAGWL